MQVVYDVKATSDTPETKLLRRAVLEQVVTDRSHAQIVLKKAGYARVHQFDVWQPMDPNEPDRKQARYRFEK